MFWAIWYPMLLSYWLPMTGSVAPFTVWLGWQKSICKRRLYYFILMLYLIMSVVMICY